MGGSSKKQRGGNNGKGEKAAATAGSDGEVTAAGVTNNNLPMANLVRVMKRVLPLSAKIGGKAKELTHDCAVEFVGFVGNEASEKAKAEHRRTIAPEDFVASFHSLGFDRYAEPMATYIQGYRQFERAGGKRRLAPAAAPPFPPLAPITFTEAELEFLQSMIPSSSDEESNGSSAPAQDGYGYGYGNDHGYGYGYGGNM